MVLVCCDSPSHHTTMQMKGYLIVQTNGVHNRAVAWSGNMVCKFGNFEVKIMETWCWCVVTQSEPAWHWWVL